MPDLAGLRVLRPVRVDAVRHAALLADLLEETRRRRAAEDRVEQRDGVAALVVAGDSRPREDDVVLLRAPPEEAVARARKPAQKRPANPRGAVRARPARGEGLHQALVGDVPRRGEHDVRADVGTGVVGAQRARRDRRDHVGACRSPACPAGDVRTPPRPRGRGRGPAGCRPPSRSPRARPRARCPRRRRRERRPCRSSHPAPGRRDRRGRGCRRPWSRATWPRSARRPSRRRARRCPARCSATTP